jgi:two-component system chemotaxis response regulator CheY
MNVMLVDDYATMRRILRQMLQQIGFINIDEAGDGSAALGKLRERPFDLVISDWNMEPMTGLQLLKEVRADRRMGKLPFIMVTAETKTDNVVAAKEAGVSNYIVKPFNATTLKQKIEACVGALAK